MRLTAVVALLICSGTSLGASITINSGDAGIRAWDGTGSTDRAVRQNTYVFTGGSTHFRTFDAADFASAQAAPLAQLLTADIPVQWGSLSGASWIHNSASATNSTPHSPGFDGGPGQSVLFAIPFNVGNATTASLNFQFLTDNGLGNANGGNGHAAPAGFANNGLFINGSDADVAYSSPGGGGAPAQFGSVNTLSFSNIAVIPNSVNWLYIYQFNWGGPGGSAFSASIETHEQVVIIPLPMAGLSGLVGLGMIALRRRRI